MKNFITQTPSCLLGSIGLMMGISLSTDHSEAASTIFRIMEDNAYAQQTPFVVEPHTRLDTLFPAVTVPGDAAATSNNQWAALVNSAYLVGGQSTLTRGRDVVEDWEINFIDPATPTVNYWYDFYSNNAATTVTRVGYPLTLTGGPMAGQSILSNNKLLAVGDDNTMWWDAGTGKVSYYNYPNGNLESTPAATTFTGGPYAGLSIASKLSSMIGYENNNLYFLEGSGTVNVYSMNMGFVRTDSVTLTGLLAGKTLGDLVDGKVAGYTYLGWDVGPIVLGVSVPEPGGPALLIMALSGCLLGRRRRTGTA